MVRLFLPALFWAMASLSCAATPPTAPAGYDTKDTNDCGNGGQEYIFFDGGDQTVTDCANRCNAWIGCSGFNYQYSSGTPSLVNRCVGKTAECKLLTGRTGMAYYQLNESITSGTVKAQVGYQGKAPSAPQKYVPMDTNDRASCAGEKELLPAGGSHQVSDCAVKCDEFEGCTGFNWVYSGGLEKRCVGKKGDCKLQSGRTGMVYYVRDSAAGGTTTTPFTNSTSSACMSNTFVWGFALLLSALVALC